MDTNTLPTTAQEVLTAYGHYYELYGRGPADLRLSPVYAYTNRVGEVVHFVAVFAKQGHFLAGWSKNTSNDVLISNDAVDFTLNLLMAQNNSKSLTLPYTEHELRRSLEEGSERLVNKNLTLLPLFYKTYDALQTPVGVDRARVNGIAPVNA